MLAQRGAVETLVPPNLRTIQGKVVESGRWDTAADTRDNARVLPLAAQMATSAGASRRRLPPPAL